MSRTKALLLALAIFSGMSGISGISGALAQSQPASQPPARMRGVITAFDGHDLHVKTRDGKLLKLDFSPDTKINVLSSLTLSDIKRGSFVGITAIPSATGSTLEALEVHVFPESLRGTGEGHYGWDLKPGSTMTNANVDAIVVSKEGEELTLSYKGGTQKIIVPQGVPIITFTPADKSLLKTGAQVFIVAQQTADGNLAALSILIGKDGMKPPM